MLVRRGDRVLAYQNRCPHRGDPLDWVPGQFLDPTGELIQCALHGALFLPETGECVHGPCLGAHLVPVAIAIEDARVLVSSTLAPLDAQLD
jgi:nitrite reductase/ring-hydroxylating ferredoxin subunit